MKLADIAANIGLEAVGLDVEITGLRALSEAGEGHLSFLENPKYLPQLRTTKASAVLVHPAHAAEVPSGCIAVVTNEPYLKLAETSALFAPPLIEQGEPLIDVTARVMPGAYVGKGARIGAGAVLFPGVYVGDNAQVGEGSILYPNVVLYRDCVVGADCIIHAGTVIGSDGFGFAHTRDGRHVKIYQLGNVIIGDRVEIGANCSIDRAAFGSTRIGAGTKIDNLVQLAHNVELGENVLIAGQTGIAGSTKIGRNVVFGAQAGVVGHIAIGDFAVIAARGGVTNTIEGGKTYSGFPLMEHRMWLKLQALLSRMTKKG